MKRWTGGILIAAGVLAFLGLSFSWFEGERELRILCGIPEVGDPLAGVTRMLETGHRLRFVQDEGGVRAWSPWTLGQARCTVDAGAGLVVATTYMPPPPIERFAAGIAALELIGLAVFQMLLAGGARLGGAAWGGRHDRLSPGARVASGVVVIVVLAGALALLERAGLVSIFDSPDLVGNAVWGLVALFAVSAGLNAASSSRAENRYGFPLALTIAALSWVVAWS